MARPKEFDRNEALQTAVQVFWRRGFEATSMTELRKSMGIGRQSLYDTFGDKEALFAEAFATYIETAMKGAEAVLARGEGLDGVHELFELTVLQHANGRQGCLIANTCVERAAHDEAVAHLARSGCVGMESRIAAALERAQASGALREDADPAALGAFLTTVLHGLAVRSRAGATFEELRSIADTALGCLE